MDWARHYIARNTEPAHETTKAKTYNDNEHAASRKAYKSDRIRRAHEIKAEQYFGRA